MKEKELNTLYLYDSNGYYIGETLENTGITYHNSTLEKPDFETNSPERYLAKVNLNTKSKVWEYEVKPEILAEEKKEQERLEAEQRQKELEEQLAIEEVTKDETQSLVFEGSSDNLSGLTL